MEGLSYSNRLVLLVLVAFSPAEKQAACCFLVFLLENLKSRSHASPVKNPHERCYGKGRGEEHAAEVHGGEGELAAPGSPAQPRQLPFLNTEHLEEMLAQAKGWREAGWLFG